MAQLPDRAGDSKEQEDRQECPPAALKLAQQTELPNEDDEPLQILKTFPLPNKLLQIYSNSIPSLQSGHSIVALCSPLQSQPPNKTQKENKDSPIPPPIAKIEKLIHIDKGIKKSKDIVLDCQICFDEFPPWGMCVCTVHFLCVRPIAGEGTNLIRMSIARRSECD